MLIISATEISLVAADLNFNTFYPVACHLRLLPWKKAQARPDHKKSTSLIADAFEELIMYYYLKENETAVGAEKIIEW